MTYLLEVVAQLDDGGCLKHPVLIDDKLTMAERVDITLNQEEVRAALDRQETLARHINAVSVPKMLDCSSSSSFKLNYSMTIIGGFGIDNDVEFHAFILHDTLEC